MSRQTKPLSATQIDKAKPKDKPYRLYDGAGLVLNIAPTGTKTWYYQYKRPYVGKSDMLKLGRYPAIGLLEARKQVLVNSELLAQNIDPKSHRKEQKIKKELEYTQDFKGIFDEWIETKEYQPYTKQKLQGYFKDILVVVGDKPVSQITVTDCMDILKPIEKAQLYNKLKKVKSIISQVMTYAIATGRATHNPAIHLRGVFKTGNIRHNPAILEARRLAELVQCVDSYEGHLVTKNALWFVMMTFVRYGEMRFMKWQDIDFNNAIWYYIPNKTRKSTQVQMAVPLAIQVIELLKKMHNIKSSDYVFPSVISNIKPISESTLTQALRRMGFSKDEQTIHGFRATARTLLEEKFEYDYRLIEMQLGHQVRDANGRAYNRVQWLDKRREMMQRWADYLDELKGKTI